jgi:mercuric ion binding protein|nr:cation transporter [Methylosarcina fibrata]
MEIKTAVICLSLLAAPFVTQTVYAAAPEPAQASLQSVTFDMQNMTCAMCSITIKKALQGVDGVKNVTVDADAKTATVTFDPQKTTLEALIKATTNAGYPATVRKQ